MKTGSCLCGDVTYRVHGEPQGGVACHCGQCRRQSGHFWASAHVPPDRIEIAGPVAWYEASAVARRGFCPRCGSFLFWTAHDENSISFSLGSLDAPTGLRLTRHIFVADKGDYYEIADDLPRESQW